jgi:hypothetical protein
MATRTITRAEYAVFKQEVEEQITVLTRQIQLLREETPEATAEVEALRVDIEEQIEQLAQQIALLRQAREEIDPLREVAALDVKLGDWIQEMGQQLAALRAQLEDQAGLGLLPRFNALVADVNDRFATVASQLAQGRSQAIVIAEDNRFAALRAEFDTKIQSLLQQIANIRVDQQVQVDQSTEVFKDLVNQQIEQIIEQINLLNQTLQVYEETLVEGDIIITEELLTEIQNIVTNIVETTIIEGGANKGSFTVNITSPGDTWTGTEVNPLFEPDMAVILQPYVKSVVTRKAGKPTDFIISVTNVDQNSFDWEMESMAKVFSGEVEVMYIWTT